MNLNLRDEFIKTINTDEDLDKFMKNIDKEYIKWLEKRINLIGEIIEKKLNDK